MTRATTRRGWGHIGQSAVPGDVVAALDELGVQMLRQTGDEVQIRCPAHFRILGKEDEHPSCSVNTETGLVGCFSCKWGGQFIVVVIEMLSCNESEAYEWIRERGGVERARRLLGRSTTVISSTEAEEITEADLALFEEVPADVASKRNLTAESLRRYGVVWDGRKGAWIIPVRDLHTGRLMGWQVKGNEKRIFKNHPKDIKKSATLFGARQHVPGTLAVVVESPLDVARLYTAKVLGGLSIYGSDVSDPQMRWLAEHASHVLLALDDDKSGRIGTQNFLEEYAHPNRVSIFNYAATSAKDVGDMPTEAIRWGVKNAMHQSLWRPDGNHLTFKRHREVSRGS